MLVSVYVLPDCVPLTNNLVLEPDLATAICVQVFNAIGAEPVITVAPLTTNDGTYVVVKKSVGTTCGVAERKSSNTWFAPLPPVR